MPREAARSAFTTQATALVAELGGSTVPSAVQMLLFQQCREETIQGNDYYIILKEYGFEKAEQPGGGGTPEFIFPLLHFFPHKLQKGKNCMRLATESYFQINQQFSRMERASSRFCLLQTSRICAYNKFFPILKHSSFSLLLHEHLTAWINCIPLQYLCNMKPYGFIHCSPKGAQSKWNYYKHVLEVLIFLPSLPHPHRKMSAISHSINS